MPRVADLNLLFGILAVQLDFVARDALLAAMNAWVLTKSKALGQILIEQGALAPERHALLEALVREHLRAHGDDAEKSLAALSSLGPARDELQRVADADVQASLARVPAGRGADDEYGTLPPGPAPLGSSWLRFRFLRPHAEGGLGKVSVAEDKELHREVALKEIKDHLADDLDSRARFLLEAEITGGLEHPGIVPVYGLGHYGDGRPFYAMRFIRGDSLREAIRRFHKADGPGRDPGERTLELRKLLGRFLDVCNAIAYAHSRGVLHRDLKPLNIMLGKYGETLVVDWGLAKPLGRVPAAGGTDERPLQPSSGSASGATVAGAAVGTPQYMSPEQAAGDLDKLGPASDVYGLGATLWCLLTGRSPFEAEDYPDIQQALTEQARQLGRELTLQEDRELVLMHTLDKVRQGEVLPPRQVKPNVPLALEAICLKAMSLKPEDRYSSPHGLADDLEHWLADEPVSVCREPMSARLWRWARRHRLLVGSVATAATAILVTGTVALLLITRAWGVAANLASSNANLASANAELANDERHQREHAEANLYLRLLALAQRAWQDNNVEQAERFLNECPSRLRRWEWDYLKRLCRSELHVLRGHTGAVLGLAHSPDRIASASRDGTVRLWDAHTYTPLHTLVGHEGFVAAVAFSPEGSRLASGGEDGKVRLWKVGSGPPLFEYSGHTKEVTALAFSPEGRYLASASIDKQVRLWDAGGAGLLRHFQHEAGVTSVAFSSQGKRLVTATSAGVVTLWDSATGKRIMPATSGEPVEGAPAPRTPQRLSAVYGLAFHPEGHTLALAGDSSVRLWKADTREELSDFRDHPLQVKSVAFSPEGQFLVSGGTDKSVRVRDLAANQESAVFKGLTGLITAVTFSPDSRHVLAAESQGTVRVWAVPAAFVCSRAKIINVAFSSDGHWLAAAEGDGSVRLWNATKGGQPFILSGPRQAAYALAFHPTHAVLAAASADGNVYEWELAPTLRTLGGPTPRVLVGHTKGVHCVAYSPEGHYLASGGEDNTVLLWDRRTGDKPRLLGKHAEQLHAVTFSPDGRLLASASEDGKVRVWDVATGSLRHTLTGHEKAVLAVVFHPTSGQLLSASADGTLRLWDSGEEKEIRCYRGHGDEVNGLALSPDGQRLASIGADRTIRVWDVATGQEVLTFSRPAEEMATIAFSPNGRRLAWGGSQSGRGVVQVLDAGP